MYYTRYWQILYNLKNYYKIKNNETNESRLDKQLQQCKKQKETIC